MATVSLKGLSKSFGKTRAVNDLTVDIADGEFFVILGPSGAGKTTTLKSIAGLVDIDAGTVTIGGNDVTRVEPYHRNVAMAFESYALYPQKTVSENLASPLKSGRTGKYTEAQRTERIDQVTTTLGINPLLKRFPRELSNGQRQRVALGRVLVRPADIYLLDEPLSHLDAKLRAAMRAELKQLGAMSKTTTVYVTHDYQEALALGDRDRRHAGGLAGADRYARGDLATAGGHVRRACPRAARDQHPRRRRRRRAGPAGQ